MTEGTLPGFGKVSFSSKTSKRLKGHSEAAQTSDLSSYKAGTAMALDILADIGQLEMLFHYGLRQARETVTIPSAADNDDLKTSCTSVYKVLPCPLFS